MKPLVISAFDLTGNMVAPWVEAGYEAWCIDTERPPVEKQGVRHIKADMNHWLPPREALDRVAFFCAFPPCTDIAVSGARWFAGKGLLKLAGAIELVGRAQLLAEYLGAPYFIENPVSVLSSHWRKPDHTFHPWQYAGLEPSDNYTKKTCLWTGGGFVMPEERLGEEPPDDRIHKAAPGPERAAFRSATPMGFARAVFAANGGLLDAC